MKLIIKYFKKIYRLALLKSSPVTATTIQFIRAHRKFPNLKRPQTFSERVCASKLSSQDERFVELSDKVAVKEWVAERLGSGWIIPNLFVGETLPPQGDRPWAEPFIIKANHGSSMLHMVRNKVDLNWPQIDRKIDQWLKTVWPKELSEEWYNRIPRKILVEPLVGEDGAPPTDYKFFVFQGEIACIQVDSNRFEDHRRDFYSSDWQIMPFTVLYKRSGALIERPKHLAEMCEAASKLGKDFSFVRVDFYDLDAGPKFGEMTFAPGSGFERFSPRKYDAWLGKFWK